MGQRAAAGAEVLDAPPGPEEERGDEVDEAKEEGDLALLQEYVRVIDHRHVGRSEQNMLP